MEIELEKPLLKIKEGLAEMQNKGLFEPRKEIDLSANKDLLAAQKTEWLPLLDTLRTFDWSIYQQKTSLSASILS